MRVRRPPDGVRAIGYASTDGAPGGSISAASEISADSGEMMVTRRRNRGAVFREGA